MIPLTREEERLLVMWRSGGLGLSADDCNRIRKEMFAARPYVVDHATVEADFDASMRRIDEMLALPLPDQRKRATKLPVSLDRVLCALLVLLAVSVCGFAAVLVRVAW